MNDSMKIVQVPDDMLETMHPFVTPFIQMGVAVDGGRTTESSYWDEIVDHNFKLWLFIDKDIDKIMAVVITSLVTYPEFIACSIELCAGEHRKRWMHLLDDIEKWAKDQGATVMEASLRKGWMPDMPDYKIKRVVAVKRL